MKYLNIFYQRLSVACYVTIFFCWGQCCLHMDQSSQTAMLFSVGEGVKCEVMPVTTKQPMMQSKIAT